MWRFNFLGLRPANDNATPPRPAPHRVVPARSASRWLVVRRAADGRRLMVLAGPVCAPRARVAS